MIVDPLFPFCDKLLEDKFNPQFIITDEILAKTKKFAEDLYPTVKDRYARRGQYDKALIIHQIQYGKVAEEMAYQLLLPYYPNLTPPDYTILKGKDKNWDSDMIDKSTDPVTKIGVKSYDIGGKFPPSWIYEYRDNQKYDTDRGVFSEEASKPGHYQVLCGVDLANKVAVLQGIVAVCSLHKYNLFQLTLKASDNKLAVYQKQLVKVKAFKTI